MNSSKNTQARLRPKAFLWDLDAGPGMVTSFAHSQHAEASLDHFSETVPAPLDDPEVESLKRELELYGYILKVVEKRPRHSHDFAGFDRVSFRYSVEA